MAGLTLLTTGPRKQEGNVITPCRLPTLPQPESRPPRRMLLAENCGPRALAANKSPAWP